MQGNSGATAKMPSVIVVEVSGAGADVANGVYFPAGRYENAQAFVRSSAAGDWVVRIKNTVWAVCNSNGHRYYTSNEKSTLPPKGGWQVSVGIQSPAPKVIVHTNVELDFDRKRCSSNVLAVQDRVWKRRRFTDAVVTCGDKSFEVHRSTLSAASVVFEAAFESPMKEGGAAAYEIKDSTPAAVEGLLSFLYTGFFNVPDAELAGLLHLAVQYEIEDLVAIVARHLLEDLTPENVQDRARALKLHRQKVKVEWEEMLARLQSDKELLAVVVPP